MHAYVLKQCLVGNIKGKFVKYYSVTYISEDSPGKTPHCSFREVCPLIGLILIIINARNQQPYLE